MMLGIGMSVAIRPEQPVSMRPSDESFDISQNGQEG